MRGLLIGNPVSKSISHITHPVIFQRHGVAATYEKRVVESSREIAEVKKERFAWIAVTMPHKETVLPFIDHFDAHAKLIKAVNMIHVVDGGWVGYNNDGIGALNAIEKKGLVEGKRLLILGAGGTARAIGYEARRRGAKVALFNRTQEKGEELARDLDVECIQTLPSPYDILVNATSVGMPIDPEYVVTGAVVFDVNYSPRNTPLLLEGVNRGCNVVYGIEMFMELTFHQLQIVFGPTIRKEIVEDVIFSV
nr:Shikimate dehydrogenase substrate binding domain protein [uncultured bacterium]